MPSAATRTYQLMCRDPTFDPYGKDRQSSQGKLNMKLIYEASPFTRDSVNFRAASLNKFNYFLCSNKMTLSKEKKKKERILLPQFSLWHVFVSRQTVGKIHQPTFEGVEDPLCRRYSLWGDGSEIKVNMKRCVHDWKTRSRISNSVWTVDLIWDGLINFGTMIYFLFSMCQ